MPIDRLPSERGTLEVRDGVAHVLTRHVLEARQRAEEQPTLDLMPGARRADDPLYTSHHATCPNANQHRRARR